MSRTHTAVTQADRIRRHESSIDRLDAKDRATTDSCYPARGEMTAVVKAATGAGNPPGDLDAPSDVDG